MSQNLTQPEEIDRILMDMAGRDMAADMPIPDEAPLNGNIRDAGRDEPVVGAVSHTAQHKQKTLDCR